ncbi:Alcohol acetyltransferase [Purpureocillium takamizusanense]|uniref:Alcohol acetyltransferase n=1 Tax=Purpureocillium takamizusanense TaxID=2060973 RepID=A0A9Q8QQ68_9HYPO|nr:Alcohol acetyltransferase [Purpureocillium takamizusanense]UNI23860.1 Alcohol acetyltransferase [Purpureocillium takamizusanense]
MSTTVDLTPLRRLSHIEHFSSTRHHIGIYRCVTVTCRYQAASSLAAQAQLDTAKLYPALAAVVAAQPMLRVGILGQDSNEAHFSHVKEVDLRNHVSFKSLECESTETYEALVAEQQGWHHDQLWPELETRPPWRLAVLQPGPNMDRETQLADIVFAFHHSLMDGTSGRRFHELLLSALNDPPQPACSSPDAPHLLSFPDAPKLPEAQEDAIPFRNSISYVAKTLWSELGPDILKPRKVVPWHGKAIDFAIPYKTRVRPVDIPHEVVVSLLQACREHSATLTGLFHALTLVSYARQLPPDEAKSFAASTPINLRPWFGPKADPQCKDHLRCLITSFSHDYPAEAVAAIRRPEADLDALIWQHAKRIKMELVERLATLPKDDINGLLKYVGDWFDFWEKKKGKTRTESWEVSNIGVLPRPPAGASWSITRLLFSNGSMVAGPALGVNIASAENGILTAGISWQDTVVPDELVDSLERDLKTYTQRLHDAGKFGAP